MDLDKSKAVMHLSGAANEAARLKRLALLFDEIDLVRPGSAVLSPEASEKVKESQYSDIITLNPFKDLYRGIELLSFDTELDETLAALEEAGVAVNCGRLVSEAERSPSYRQWRDPMIAQAMRDGEWNRLTHTSKDAYSRIKVAEVKIRLDSGGEEKYLWLQQPPAVWCADDIATAGYLAQHLDACPVFPDEFKPLLKFKYDQYQLGTEQLTREDQSLLPFDHRARFGETAFAIANSVFSSHSVENKSIEEILKYREEMDIARRRFLSSDLVELQGLVSENPWGPEAEAEVSKYVKGKLAGDVAAFESESVSTWERLYGALAVRTGSVAQSGAIGGGLGGLAAQILPSTSVWQVLVGGLAVGAAKELPNVIGDIAKAVNEDRERNRSGIAYIARFNNNDLGSDLSSFFKRTR